MTTHFKATRNLLKTLASMAVFVGVFVPSALVSQAAVAPSQGPDKQPKLGKDGKPKQPKEPREPITLYNSLTPLAVTLTTNIGRIRKDKGENAPWREGTISYTGEDGKPVVIPVKLHTRGIWRLKNCQFPPVRLNFTRETTKGTVFAGLNKPKLVSYCRDEDTFEQYVLQEYQLYRIYNMLTTASHKARLVQMTYTDSANGKVEAKRAAIILEEPEELADRFGTKLVKDKGAGPDFMEPHHNALVGLFEYMIGNTDWSIFALHNIELLQQPDGNVIPVPMDFDFAGVISTRYATPDPKLNIGRVRDRIFRGFCGPPEEIDKAITLFREKKDAIYALYADSIGKMIRKDQVEETLKYYDDFYKTINDRRAVKREIIEPCITGH